MSDLFSKQSEAYARFRPHYPKELFEFLLEQTPGRDLAWDVATGNGQAAVSLAESFKRVYASDLSPDQIKNATAHPKIEYHAELAEKSRLADQSVDLITVAQGAHWFDLDLFFAEAKRVLKPGGVIALFGYVFFEPFAGSAQARPINAAIDEFTFKTLGPYWKPELKTLWNRYKSIPFPFHEVPSKPFSIHVEANLEEMLGYFSTWSAVQLYKDAKGEDPVNELKKKLEPDWRDPDKRRKLEWKLALRIGRN